jgi:hypothetical protein
LERKVDDWVGRNIAERRTVKNANFVTLTYGRDLTYGSIDHLRAAVLTYSDVQKYLKYLRVDGYPMRYFVSGEYGSKKGRAHWHILLYWHDAVPEHEIRQNFMQRHWPHGWSYWDHMDAASVRYCCKYLTKDADDAARQSFGPMPSKKPPLGDAYFRELAIQHVEAGLPLQSLFYSFPEVKRVHMHTKAKTAKGFRDSAKPINFRLSGKSAENYLKTYVDGWRDRYGDDPPRSEPVWKYLDREASAPNPERVFMPRFKGGMFYPPQKQVPPKGGTRPEYDNEERLWRSVVAGQNLISLDGLEWF